MASEIAVELLPCPYCGSKNVAHTPRMTDGDAWRRVHCLDCNAIGPAFPDFPVSKSRFYAEQALKQPADEGI